MPKKWVLGAAVVFVTLAVAGVGFAAFSSSVYLNGTASAGTVSLTISGFYSPPPGCASPSGSPTAIYPAGPAPSNTVYFNVSGLFPGGPSCSIDFYIKNIGTLPAMINSTATYYATTCSPTISVDCYQFFDSTGINLAGGSYTGGGTSSYVILPGATLLVSATFSIPAGSTYVNGNAAVDVTYTGSWGI